MYDFYILIIYVEIIKLDMIENLSHILMQYRQSYF